MVIFEDIKNAATRDKVEHQKPSDVSVVPVTAPVVPVTSSVVSVVPVTAQVVPVVLVTAQVVPVVPVTAQVVPVVPVTAPVVPATPAKIYGFTKELYDYIKNEEHIRSSDISRYFSKSNHYIDSYLHRLKKYGLVIKADEKWMPVSIEKMPLRTLKLVINLKLKNEIGETK